MVVAAQPVPCVRPSGSGRAGYDAWNRLVRVDRGARIFGWYLYDGLHRRIWRIVDGFDYPNRTDYYYNTSWQVLEERFYDGENPYTTVATDVTCQYVWDPRYIDAPVCRDKDGNSDGDCTDTDWDTGDDDDEHLYYCQDANFNTTALVERSDGSVVERYVYDPYGKVTIYDDDWSDTVTWANSKKNEILYCGYRWDPESGLYHVRNRMYHPTLGRWMQRDPIGYADGMSLYEYVMSSPAGNVDWTGLAGLTPEEIQRMNQARGVAAAQRRESQGPTSTSRPPATRNPLGQDADRIAGLQERSKYTEMETHAKQMRAAANLTTLQGRARYVIAVMQGCCTNGNTRKHIGLIYAPSTNIKEGGLGAGGLWNIKGQRRAPSVKSPWMPGCYELGLPAKLGQPGEHRSETLPSGGLGRIKEVFDPAKDVKDGRFAPEGLMGLVVALSWEMGHWAPAGAARPIYIQKGGQVAPQLANFWAGSNLDVRCLKTYLGR